MIPGIVAGGMASGGPAPSGDPYWANVVSLLFGTGADLAGAITDQASPRVWSAAGGVALASDPGDVSPVVVLANPSPSVSAPSDASMRWTSASEFTAEVFVYMDAVDGNQCLLGHMTPGGIDTDWTLVVGPDLKLSLCYINNNAQTWVSSPSTIAMGAWHHIAFSISGGNVLLFCDGLLLRTTAANSPTYYSNRIAIGNVNGPYAGPQNFRWHDMRITSGVARYTADYTVPTVPLPTS